MHSVQVPVALPEIPATDRFVKLNVPEPVGNVPVGNAVTVAPLCASVPRRIDRNACVPGMSSLTSDASPACVTVRLVHAEPLSIVGRFGVAEPDQCCCVPQLPTIRSDHELSVPVSMLARSWTS